MFILFLPHCGLRPTKGKRSSFSPLVVGGSDVGVDLGTISMMLVGVGEALRIFRIIYLRIGWILEILQWF